MGPFGSDIKVENFVDDGVPVLNGANLLGYKLNDNSFNYVTLEKAKTFRKAIAKRGDIIITHRGTLGQICYVPENSKFEQYVISQSQFRVKFNEAQIDPRYIVYLFHTPYGQKKLLSFKSHVGVPALAQATTNFRALNILIHKLSDQKKIANVITAIEDKIELNNRINSELEQMAKTIYDYWFVQFDFPISAEYAASVGQPQLEGKPYKSSGRKMVWSEELKREVPEGWEVKKLENVINKIIDNRGKTPLKLGGDWSQDGQGVIALSAKHVKDGRLIKLEDANVVTFEMFEKWMPNKLEEGDILMTSEAPCGEFYMILNDTDYCLSQRLFAMRAEKTKVYPSYLYYELAKGNGYSQIIGKQSGSTVFGIRQDELRTVNILVPKLSLQRLFDEKVKPMLLQIRTNEAQCRKLTELRDWLLPMLMNGQVKVGEDVEEEMMGMAAEPLGEYIVRGE